MALFSTQCPFVFSAQFQLEPAFPNLQFTRPVDLAHPGDGTSRLFVVEQSGKIHVFENRSDVSSASLFLNIEDRVNDPGNEEGLLGIAFHPEFETNGYFYVDYTAANPRRTVIARYTVSGGNPSAADRNSEQVILEAAQPYSNHNGGQLVFGPDSMLYIAFGDGGSAGDPEGNGQNRQTLLGSILRIDVDSPAAGRNYIIPPDNPFFGNTSGYREEIYAYGLRNPWRFSFDFTTGRMWAADVGQNWVEEVDIIEKGGNYGWNIMEGTSCFSPSSGCNQTGLKLPVWEYYHNQSGGTSITGGFVYRGKGVPELYGTYICADFTTGRIWSLEYDGQNPPAANELLDTDLLISSFGVDENDELYICAFDGTIYRFKPTVTPVEDNRGLPLDFELLQNYPNPFNAETAIRYRISRTVNIKLDIFDMTGRHIRNLVSGIRQRGEYSAFWNGKNDDGKTISSGVYLYRLRTATGETSAKKLLFLK